MNGLSITTHVAAAIALVINLWVAGDLVELWLGHSVRNGFELLLTFGYAVSSSGFACRRSGAGRRRSRATKIAGSRDVRIASWRALCLDQVAGD